MEFQFDRLRSLREEAGLSQGQLGKRLGISDRAVSKWETGLSTPSAKHMVMLCKILHIPVERLLVAEENQSLVADQKGMESITALYKIGRGPSSSHTIGPERACQLFAARYPKATSFHITLYGSLAKTGTGHGTDRVIQKTFAPFPCKVVCDPHKTGLLHPNTMELCALQKDTVLGKATVLSVGGGNIVFVGEEQDPAGKPYQFSSFTQIATYCKAKDLRLWQYAEQIEGPKFRRYMETIWDAMKQSIQNGLQDEGILPGGLQVHKKAKSLYQSQHIDETAETRENREVCAYAFAVSEQNAAGEIIVTAPTCGAAGVLPAVLYYQQKKHSLSDEAICNALITAGVIGNIIKTNASISGAECGCQAEIGSACAMAAAALAELFRLDLDKIEYAAEIAIEHHLGLTCDPICGLVQIPCIERNAVAAMRAINAVSLASFLWDTRKISFDRVVQTMKETGHDLPNSYKETAEAGLAKIEL